MHTVSPSLNEKFLSYIRSFQQTDDERFCQLIPESWEYFRVENLYFHGKPYRIVYDKTGNHYHMGTGILIQPMEF